MSLDPPVLPEGRWAVAPTLARLRFELLAAYPALRPAHLQTIGDADHRSRDSDHNPNDHGYVRALDVMNVDHGGPDLRRLALFLRLVGEGNSQRLNPGGYVIYDRRKASAESGWHWRPYRGDNPHTDHLHVSCSRKPAYYGLQHRWNVAWHLEEIRQAERR